MTGYFIVLEPDEFFADDFGNDDAPVPKAMTFQLDFDWSEAGDELFVDDFGNDDRKRPKAPTGLTVVVH